ncbi:lamin tail domain-containing protein, partial [bacterium]|nr:lamin tail domain-containing protein [candidate division CSSED10-310 bacterium]
MKPKRMVIGWIASLWILVPAVSWAQVVINEILYDPMGSDTGFEFVELMNAGGEAVVLDGYELKLADSNYYAFVSFILNPGSRVVIHNNADGDDTPTDLFTGTLANMGNTHGSVALFSGEHTTTNIVDFMQYGDGGEQWESAAVTAGIWTADDFVPDADEGLSVNLDPDGEDNNVSTDWAACNPSPLEPNCSPAPTATPTVSPSPTSPPTSTPTLHPTTSPPPSNTPTATATPPTNTPTGTVVPPTQTPTFTPTQHPTTPAPPTNTPTATSGPPTDTPTSGPTATTTPIVASVIINEIFYDPMGSDTGLEWIELLNISANAVALTGWELKPDAADYYVFPSFTLAAQQRVIIHINATGDDTETELFAGPSSNMGNTAGSVTLFTEPSHTIEAIVDFMQYGAGDQTWENLAVSAGIWLEDDFVPDADEGYSLNRYPDGEDGNTSADWEACLPSAVSTNCIAPTITPTVSPSPPPTDTPTTGPGTPTVTPSPTETPTEPTPTPTVRSGAIINEVLFNPEGT